MLTLLAGELQIRLNSPSRALNSPAYALNALNAADILYTLNADFTDFTAIRIPPRK